MCTGGALGGDTDLSIGSAGAVTGNPGMVGPGLLGSAAGQMNLLFLAYWAPDLVWIRLALRILPVGVLVNMALPGWLFRI